MKESSVPFQWTTLEDRWIHKEETSRLDASFFSQDAIEARILMKKLKKKGIKIGELGDSSLSAKIFWPGRFKRKYVSRKEGKPFLMPTEVFMFLPKARKFITDPPQNVLVREGWILVTRSGTIGRCVVSNRLLSTFVLSDDLIRVVVAQKRLLGYIYAYLNTWIGQAFLTKAKYGATVKHIEPHHAASIPIPIIPEIEEEVNDKILKAYKLRDRAQELLLKADEMIYSELSLPEIDDEDVEYFCGDRGRLVRSFITKASELNLRLDASYHVPILHKIDEILSSSPHNPLSLDDVVEDIFIPTRFKRPYVSDSKIGIPFLQGSHIPLIKPFDIRYIWNRMKNLQKVILRENWILMTRSGTVGRIALVREGWKGWGASEHILRIIPKGDVNPGYLIAFLSTSYGQIQIDGKVYGGVVEELAEQDTSFIREIKILMPSSIGVQGKIGNLVIEAYDKKDQANIIEEEAIRLLENNLIS